MLMMDFMEAHALAAYSAKVLMLKYGLNIQYDSSLEEDMRQQAITCWLEAIKKGQNEKQAVWRGLHEEVRSVVYGGSGKHTTKVAFVKPTESVSNDMSVEDKVDWWRAAEKLSQEAVYDYYVKDMDLKEIGTSNGVTESAICHKLSAWKKSNLRNA